MALRPPRSVAVWSFVLLVSLLATTNTADVTLAKTSEECGGDVPDNVNEPVVVEIKIFFVSDGD